MNLIAQASALPRSTCALRAAVPAPLKPLSLAAGLLSLALGGCGGSLSESMAEANSWSQGASAAQDAGWRLCSGPGDTCTVDGTRAVRMGLSSSSTYTEAIHTGAVWCDISKFPADPAPGQAKSCWVSEVALSASASTTASSVAAAGATVATPTTGISSASSGTSSTGATTVSTAAASDVGLDSSTVGPRVGSFVASGGIVARSGQVISGLKISNPNGACITLIGVSGVVVRDNQIGPCGAEAVRVADSSSGNTVEHNLVSADIGHGIRVLNAPGNTVQKNRLTGVIRQGDFKHGIEVMRSDRSRIIGNVFTGAWRSDILSGYESSDSSFTDNVFDGVSIDEPTGASFTIGDSTTGRPGTNNYIARNKVLSQSGGVPAGVFGSGGNTVLEFNCFSAGIQAYNYSGTFVGVTVRKNVINMGASFVPDKSVIGEWGTNVNSTDCSKVPQS